jgi:hypothetical protein
MKAKQIAVLLATLVLLATTTAQPQEKDQPASGTRTASCLIKVTCDPDILPLSFETIEYLLCSSGVGGKAAVEVLGVSADKSCELFSIEPLAYEPERFTARRARGRAPRPRPSLEFEDEDYRQELALGVQAKKEYERKRYSSRKKAYPEPGDKEEDMEELEAYRRMMGGDADKPKTPPTPARPATRGRGAASRRVLKPRATPAASSAEQTLLFRLKVDLPAEIEPRAEEFMGSIINSLRGTVNDAYWGDHMGGLHRELERADELRQDAQRELDSAMGISRTDADIKTRDQLDDSIVDLSMFEPEMAFADAIEILKNSVDPPLRIVVLWSDLIDNAEVDRTTSINMDPMPGVPLRKALELLLKSVSAGIADLGYVIERGVISIATVETLPRPQDRLLQIMRADASREMLVGMKEDLLHKRQSLDMDVARLQAHGTATEEQIARISDEVTRKLKDDPVAAELAALVDLHAKHAGRAPGERIEQVLEKLARAKIELAKHREELSKSAGGDLLRGFSSALAMHMVQLAEKRAELGVVASQFTETERQLEAASSFDPQISQMRLAKQALGVAEYRLNGLKTRLASLQEPSVTVLGAD